VWQEDCWIFGVDITEDTVRRWFGEGGNRQMDLVVVADDDMGECRLSHVLRELADNPPSETTFEHPNENVILYDNATLGPEEISRNLIKIVRLLDQR